VPWEVNKCSGKSDDCALGKKDTNKGVL
jgi:hypothetical protein